MDVNRADREMLLRVPGIGPKSVSRICRARRESALGLEELRRLGVVLKRARYFISCKGYSGARSGGRLAVARALIDPDAFSDQGEQLSLFAAPALQQLAAAERPALQAAAAREEAVHQIAKQL